MGGENERYLQLKPPKLLDVTGDKERYERLVKKTLEYSDVNKALILEYLDDMLYEEISYARLMKQAEYLFRMSRWVEKDFRLAKIHYFCKVFFRKLIMSKAGRVFSYDTMPCNVSSGNFGLNA
jgi:hypothetical protein